jgi:hypothetical protein
VTLCAICTMHVETRSADFLVEGQNHGRRFVSSLVLKPLGRFFSNLTSKPVATVSPDLASKPVGRVFWFVPQNRQLQFDDLGLKITATIYWFVSQNQEDYDLSVALQN